MTRQRRRLVLASNSPRRADLLKTAGYRFVAEPPLIDEIPRSGETARAAAVRFAREKAAAVSARRRSGLVLAADTVVEIRGTLLGKPDGPEQARRMLVMLSGQSHRVFTGVALSSSEWPRIKTDCSVTSVRFRRLSSHEIDWYVATGEPMDKAGGYGIQGRAALFIREISGSHTNVMGLPMEIVYRMLGLPP